MIRDLCLSILTILLGGSNRLLDRYLGEMELERIVGREGDIQASEGQGLAFTMLTYNLDFGGIDFANN